MKKILYLLCGPAGSGKSTWAAKDAAKRPNSIIISRDAVRFELMEDGDTYFKHEPEVFLEYCRRIREALMDNIHEVVYADATQLSRRSRNKVLNRSGIEEISEVEIIPVNVCTPLRKCLNNNKRREGLGRVPDATVRQMHRQFEPATFEEKYTYSSILNVGGKKKHGNLFNV
jgi:predicted kinase